MIRLAETQLPTRWGTFRMIAYANEPEEMPHLALVSGHPGPEAPVLVRVHSECMTGDVFGSLRCDCGEQLAEAMRRIAAEGGVLIYLRQEGRGIGLVNKIRAYTLQDQGMDTVDANLELGFEADMRSFDIAVAMLSDLGVRQVRLMTNNPDKIAAFEEGPVALVERVPIEISPRDENQFYLATKQRVMGHYLQLPWQGPRHAER
jgi:3,4-dihydroxy 2-butanone 4-phosphate synthase/GTP cyclohydrolase II